MMSRVDLTRLLSSLRASGNYPRPKQLIWSAMCAGGPFPVEQGGWSGLAVGAVRASHQDALERITCRWRPLRLWQVKGHMAYRRELARGRVSAASAAQADLLGRAVLPWPQSSCALCTRVGLISMLSFGVSSLHSQTTCRK